MNRRPRQRLKVLSQKAEIAKQEFRKCTAPGCANVVSPENKPPGVAIYCILHSYLAER
jgi:hypothetical protein